MDINKRREIAYMLGAVPVPICESADKSSPHDFLVMFGDEVWTLQEGTLFPDKVLAYELNYNLLMSGVEFVESLGYKFPIDGTNCKVYRESSTYGKTYNEGTKRQSIFVALYEFAKIYNLKRVKQSWED